MKKLTIQIHAEIDIPDDWEIVQHPNGINVLKINGTYVDFNIAPLTTDSDEVDVLWSDENEALTDEILDGMTALDTELKINYQQ